MDWSTIERQLLAQGELQLNTTKDNKEEVEWNIDLTHDDPENPLSLSILPTTLAPQATNERRRIVIWTKFYVLKNIEMDVAVGMSSLESLIVYTDHCKNLVSRPMTDVDIARLHHIILVSAIEQRFRGFSCTWLSRLRMGKFSSAQVPLFESALNEADQEGNSLQELAKERINTLAGTDKTIAEADETHRRTDYEEYRALVMICRPL